MLPLAALGEDVTIEPTDMVAEDTAAVVRSVEVADILHVDEVVDLAAVVADVPTNPPATSVK